MPPLIYKGYITMTATFTFNKSNWSGETATIKVSKNQFEFHGETFAIGPIEDIPDPEGTDPKWSYSSIQLFWDGKPWQRIYRFGKDACWTFDSEGFSREHKEPAVLCAIAAANLI